MSAKTRRPRRITGLETEYGCLVESPGEGPRLTQMVRDWIFARNRYGLVDLHDRGWDEAPGNGGFLFNGGRAYVDMGHLEYCTPECTSVGDIVRFDRAGDEILLTAVRELNLEGRVSFIRNNIDHHSGATFGCHENFSLLRDAPLTEKNVLSLLAFLTLRILFTGAGRVGGATLRGPEVGPGLAAVPFQVSQRADFIQNDFYEWVQQNRAIINTRDEPLADPLKYRRLHLIHGDTNVLPSALYLKVGATRLVLDLLEADALPTVILADAVRTLRELSRQAAPPWPVACAGGTRADARDLLQSFRTAAEREFRGRDPETDAVLDLWLRVEQGLAGDLPSLVGLVDWVTKLHLLEAFRAQEKIAWNDLWLEAQDLEYHQVDRERSLGLALADWNGPWAEGWGDVTHTTQPPADTRATPRSQLMHDLAGTGQPYELDWDSVLIEGRPPILLPDPLAVKLPR